MDMCFLANWVRGFYDGFVDWSGMVGPVFQPQEALSDVFYLKGENH